MPPFTSVNTIIMVVVTVETRLFAAGALEHPDCCLTVLHQRDQCPKASGEFQASQRRRGYQNDSLHPTRT